MDYKLRNYTIEGQLGQEKTVYEYINNLSAIFHECYRILKQHGTCWVVIGDTYNSKSGGMEDLVRYGENVRQAGKIKYKYEGVKQKQKLQEDIKKQSLMLVPMRFGIRMIDDGWTIRNTIIWHKCLSKNTNLFIFKDGKYQFLTIKELANSFSDNIRIPTQDMKGNTIWIKIKNINYNGKQQVFKITTKSGNEIICTDNHIFPTRKSLSTSNNYRKIALNRCDELNIGLDKLYINEKLDINIPEGNNDDYYKGYFTGFYMADDIKRGYIENFITVGKFKQYIYGNGLHIVSRDKNLLTLVLNFINGDKAKGKYFTNDIFNQNLQFLKGIIDGFLSGDGHFDKKNNRWKIGITNNYKLKDQINLICRILGYDFRFENERFAKIGNKKYSTIYFSIRKISKRLKTFGCKLDTIDKIESMGIEDVYDIEVYPIYTSFCGKGKTEKETLEKKKSKYNHLYFLANGVWTHNSNCMPSSIKTRFTVDYEYVFFMIKDSKSYYFDTQYEPMKITTLQRSQRNIGYKKQATGNYAINDKSCRNYNNNLNEKIMATGIKFGGNKLAGGDNPTYSGNKWVIHPDFKRIMRTVWEIPTENYSGKHYATYPKKLVQRCLEAGCAKEICSKCQMIRTKIKKHKLESETGEHNIISNDEKPYSVKERKGMVAYRKLPNIKEFSKFITTYRFFSGLTIEQLEKEIFNTQAPHHWFSGESFPSIEDWKKLKTTIGIPDDNPFEFELTKEYFKPAEKMNVEYEEVLSDCGCTIENNERAPFLKGIVLDPFMGAGTTGLVAKKNNLNFIGIEINPDYIKQAIERINS